MAVYLTKHEEMKRFVANAQRSVAADAILFSSIRRKLNIASLVKKNEVAANSFSVRGTRGRGGTPIKPTSIDEGLKPHNIEKVGKLVEQNRIRLMHLTNIKLIIDKHFDPNDRVVVKLKEAIEELQDQINDLIDNANSAVTKSVSSQAPQKFKSYIQKISKWVDDANLKIQSKDVQYEIAQDSNGLVYLGRIILKKVRAQGVTLDYYINVIQSQTRRGDNYRVSVHNSPLTLAQLQKLGIGEIVNSVQEAIKFIGPNFGIGNKKRVTRKTKSPTYNKAIQNIVVKDIDNNRFFINVNFRFFKTLKQVEDYAPNLFMRIKKWNTDNGKPIAALSMTLRKNDKNMPIITFVFKRGPNSHNITREAVREFILLFEYDKATPEMEEKIMKVMA